MSTHLPTCYRHPDRETGLSCSECGRPICTECMTAAPVGLRCPDHAGRSRASQIRPRRVTRAPGAALATTQAPVTKIIIALNLAIYLITASQGAGLNNPGGTLFDKTYLSGPAVADGGWWRLITTMFLHGSILHIAFNMFALAVIGIPVEQYLGRARYLGLYFAAGLAGSAGALLQAPHLIIVGASGAIFGILGAMLIIEWQLTGRLAGNAMTWIVINLALSFAIPNVAWGGHVGGLLGGIVAMLAFAGWGQGRAAYGRLGFIGALGVVAVAVISVAVAYWKVHGLA